LLKDGKTWKRLDELTLGDEITVSGGQELWPENYVNVSWQQQHRMSLNDAAEQANVSIDTVLRYSLGRNIRNSAQVAQVLEVYDAPENQNLPQSINKRQEIKIPEFADEMLGAFLGYMVGDGHISRVKRNLGLTTADKEQAEHFSLLSIRLFGLPTSIKWDDGRYRVLLHSEMLSDYLINHLGLTFGKSAALKEVPKVILQSPEPVVREFISAYFDSDACAGGQGVILSSMSKKMVQQVQLLLLNYNILSRARQQTGDNCWHLHIAGKSAEKYLEKIGFHLKRKQDKLEKYISDHKFFKEEDFSDEVVSLEEGVGDVYDISVEETHRYAAAGVVNHNSYWHSTIMTQKAMDASEVIDFADHHSGTMAMTPQRLNPYKIGIELFRHIEERWNKGQFGRDYDRCEDMVEKKNWDTKAGKGRDKIFEVRKIYNDVMFLDEFLTADFCRQYKLFAYSYNPLSNRYEISDRDFKIIKQKLLQSLTNFGSPIISIVDANFGNRGELKLQHTHDGVDLDIDYARETLRALFSIWKRPVLIETKVNNNIKIHKFDGDEHKTLDSKEGV